MKTATRNMTKWLLSLVFALVVISLVLIPQVLKVESSAHTTTIDTSWYDANTSATEYTLYDAADFLGFMKLCYDGTRTSFTGVTIYLGADINLNPGWSAACTVSNNVVTFPSKPGNYFDNTNVPANFYGTLDGQGHTLSGFYSDRGMGDGNEFGGMFNYMRGTIKNIAIVNSFMRADRGSNWGSQNQRFGGIAGAFTPGSKLQNAYIDAEVWFRSNNHYTFGYLAAGFNGGDSNVTIENVTLRGRFAVAGSANEYGKSASSGCKCGYLCGETNSKAVVINNVLIDVTKAAPKMSGSGGTNNVNWLCHYSNSMVTGAATAKIGKVASDPSLSGWVYSSTISSYLPQASGFYVGIYTRIESWPTSASTLHISTPGQLLQFEYLLDHDTTFSGKTVYLDNDIDINPNWNAGVSFSAATGMGLANSTGTITLPSYPINEWTNIGRMKSGVTKDNQAVVGFQGTFDGQYHTISGVYAIRETASTASGNGHTYGANNQTTYAPSGFGLLFNRIQSGATVRNVSVTNSICVWNQNFGNSEAGFGGLIGGMSGSGGVCTVQNIYSEVNVILQSTNHPSVAMGGIVAWQGSGTISNCVYNGVMATTNGADSTSYPAQNVNKHLGGIAGESEGGTMSGCLGIVTFAAKEPYQATMMGSNQSNSTTGDGACNQVVPSHYDSDYGTATNCFEGAQLIEVVSGWKYITNVASYVPATIADNFFSSYIGEPVAELHITNAAEFLEFRLNAHNGITYTGWTIYLDNDIDLAPGWDATPTFSTALSKGINTASGTMVRPANSQNRIDQNAAPYTSVTQFKGVFDGQGHTIRGLQVYKQAGGGENAVGLLFDRIQDGGTVKNLRISNSSLEWDQCAAGTNMGGVVGCISKNGHVQNVLVDEDVYLINHHTGLASGKVRFGGITSWMQDSSGSTTCGIENCVFLGVMITTTGQNSLNYPGAGGANIELGGLVSLMEKNSTITNCVFNGTILTNLTSRSQLTASGSAGYNFICPYKTASESGQTITTSYGSAQTSSPAAGWLNYTCTTVGSYVPANFLGGYQTLAVPTNSSISSFTAGTHYYPGSVFNITSADDFASFISKINADTTYYGEGVVFRLTGDIDLNPGSNLTIPVSGGYASFPVAPPNSHTVIDNFKGTLDGQGYTLSGFYRSQNMGDSTKAGGIFTNFSGKLKNLAITNSLLIGSRGSSWGSVNQQFGGFAHTINGGAVISNVYFDMEVWYKADNHYNLGMIASIFGNSAGGRISFNNVTIRGRFSVAGSANDVGHTASSSSPTGIVAGDAKSVTAVFNSMLVNITQNTPKKSGSAGTSNVNYLAHYGNSKVSGCDTVTFQTNNTSATTGWTSQMSTIGTYTPGTIVPHKYVYAVTDQAISSYANGNYYKGGSSYLINSFDDYNTFVTKINADPAYGGGYIFKITADMNVNPTWRAKGEVEWDGEAGSVDFSSTAPNAWPTLDSFRGTLDGQGHVLEGLYSLVNLGGTGNKVGLIAKDLGHGATIQNLLIRNSRLVAKFSSSDSYTGGIAGYISGNDVTLKNIYLDMDLVVAGWSAQEIGGFIGHNGLQSNATAGNNVRLSNLMFVGTMYHARPGSSNISFTLPSSSTGTYMSELVANVNNKTTLYATQIILAGMRYASPTTVGRNKWQGSGNSDSTAYGTKMRYDFILLEEMPYDGEDWEGFIYDEDWLNEYLVGGAENVNNYTSLDIADAFAYSAGLEMQVPAGLQSMIDTAIAAGRFHNFNPITVSIMDRTGEELAGSVYTISNASELMYAVNLSQDNDVTFSGYTLRLTANIDLNPGWTGHVTVSDGEGTLPNLPVNIFHGFKKFNGTFDGSNYYISGIFMIGVITNSSFHLAPFLETGTATIKRVKLINGLVLAQDNYAGGDKYTENKIAGLVARNSGVLTVNGVYNAMEVWYNGTTAQKIAGFVSINNSGSGGSTLNMDNITFAGVVGNMHSANGLHVPNTSTGTVLSKLVADGGNGTVTIQHFTTSGATTYQSSASATAKPPAMVTVGTSGTVTLGTGTEGEGTAAVISISYVNPLATKFKTNVYSGSDTPTQYEGGHDTYVYNYKFLSKQDNFNAFGGKLAQNGYTGYTLVQSYQIGSNYYALYENPNEYSLFVTYIETGDSNSSAGSGRGSVFVSPAGTEYNLTKTASAATNLCKPQIWQLDVDNAWSTASGGMGYVIRLSNGHFIIIDGGYASNYDARHIYKVLKENNVVGGKPQVDAWFFTHLHDDHFGAFLKFAANYATQVDIDAFYFNFPSDTVSASEDDEGINTDSVFTMIAAMKSWPAAHIYSKPHAGMTFGFDGLEVTILATHESVSMYYYDTSWHANSFNDGNDTSMVAKFTFFPGAANEQTFMMNGDACTGISNFLSTAYAAADLKADIIQVSHHGWKGLTQAVYTMMDKYSGSTKKSVFLWPQDIIGYSHVNDTYYYKPTAWDGHQDQQGNDYGGNFGYLYTVSQSNSAYGAANYYIKGHAKEVIPAYKDHALTIPYRANTYYTATYWTSGSNSNIQSAYNTKKNTTTNWDGSASGLTKEEKWPIEDWWNNGENSTYNIDDLVDFYNFVYYAQSNDFSGKTVNLNCNITANAYNGTVTFADGKMTVQTGLNEWKPIPNFAGTFNGNDHTISGLYALVIVNNTGNWGGFIKKLTGGTIKNLAITNSAFVFKNTAGWGSANIFCGAIVGAASGTATIQDCIFDVNSYEITNYIMSYAGVVAKVDSEATLNLTRVTYSGEIAYVTAGNYKGGAISGLTTGQNMYGPMGILGHKNEGTVNLTDVKFIGTRVAPSSVSGGSNFSADLYASQVTTGTVNVSGDNEGGTTGGATPAAAPTETAVTQATATTTAVTPATAPTYVYVPQLNKVLDAARANQVNPIFSQQTAVADSKTNIRLVGTMTREAAIRAYTLGFKLTIVRSSDGKKAVTCTSQYDAYQTITANGNKVTAEQLGGEYIYAMVLNNLPASGTFTIYAQTRFLDQEGVEHFGGLQTITVVNGVIQ